MRGIKFTDVIDALTSQIAVLSLYGQILYVNKAWKHFARANSANDADAYVGQNYLHACEKAAQSGDTYAIEACERLRLAMSGEAMHQVLVYPCHSPTKERWFELRLDRNCEGEGDGIIVASHLDVTGKVLTDKTEAQIKSELAVANLELDRALERERRIASTDVLTGIGNRRQFYELAGHAMAVARRYETPTALLLFDIDLFKRINDALGHQQGDDCLRAVASAACRELREADILARYGGDEFIALLPRTEAEAALKIGRRMVDTVRRECSYKNHPDVRVTISMGIATYPKDAQDLETLIIHADQALYDAKNAGRARAVPYKQTD